MRVFEKARKVVRTPQQGCAVIFATKKTTLMSESLYRFCYYNSTIFTMI